MAGDAAYNDAHQYLSESGPEGRRAWLAALDVLESLRPRVVVAGHKLAGTDDGAHIIEETRRYILDFDRAAAGNPGVSLAAAYHGRGGVRAAGWLFPLILAPPAADPGELRREP